MNIFSLQFCTICTHSKIEVGSGPPSLQNEFDNIQTVERSAETDTLKQMNQATSPQSDQPSPVQPPPSAGRSTTKNEKRSANTLYQELSFQDNEESEENEVTGKNIKNSYQFNNNNYNNKTYQYSLAYEN